MHRDPTKKVGFGRFFYYKPYNVEYIGVTGPYKTVGFGRLKYAASLQRPYILLRSYTLDTVPPLSNSLVIYSYYGCIRPFIVALL